MGNPFFLPDVPAQTTFGALKRQGGRFAPILMLVIGGAWLALSVAAILLTLSDVMPAASGAHIAELE